MAVEVEEYTSTQMIAFLPISVILYKTGKRSCKMRRYNNKSEEFMIIWNTCVGWVSETISLYIHMKLQGIVGAEEPSKKQTTHFYMFSLQVTCSCVSRTSKAQGLIYRDH